MSETGLHFENSNLDEYDIDRDKHEMSEMSGNAHEDLKISFEG